MDALILNQYFETVDIVDAFDSFIWVDRYLGHGDFELYMPMSSSVSAFFQQDNYISLRSSDRLMIIEALDISTEIESGTNLIISGRSLESILERRIVWGQKILSGNFQNAIKTLLNENVINPAISSRKIPNFTFKPSTNPVITSLEIEYQVIGENLYETIFTLCEMAEIGFRILPGTTGGSFIFELYSGVDRSYAQNSTPYVIFSPNFENLLSSNYYETKKTMKTAALIAGEGDWPDKTTVAVGGGSGLNRREIFVEAHIRSTDEEHNPIEPDIYLEMLEAKGLEELAKMKAVMSFEGEIDATRQFVYGKDFFIGDIVQVINEYGLESTARVSELIQIHNVEGESFFPTFT